MVCDRECTGVTGWTPWLIPTLSALVDKVINQEQEKWRPSLVSESHYGGGHWADISSGRRKLRTSVGPIHRTLQARHEFNTWTMPIRAPRQKGIFRFGLKTRPRMQDLLLVVLGNALSNHTPVTWAYQALTKKLYHMHVQMCWKIHKVGEIPKAVDSELSYFLSKPTNLTRGQCSATMILPDQLGPYLLRVCSFFSPSLPPSETCFSDFLIPLLGLVL